MSKDIFLPSIKYREAPFRGRMKSRDYNAFQDEAISDFSRVSKVLNNLSSRFENRIFQLESELRSLQAFQRGVLEEKSLDDIKRARASEDITWTQTFHDTRAAFFTGITDARRLQIDPIFGNLYLPINRKVSRLYSFNPTTQELFLPSSLTITVKENGEGGGDVKEGNPALAVDGRVGEGWIRQVVFPPEKDRRHVIVDVTLNVPSAFADKANLLTLFPSPAGEVDVLNIWYSTTDSEPTTVLQVYDDTGSLSDFAAKYEVQALQLHFADTSITKLKIRIQQRRSVVENNEMVFPYGFREIHLDLVEWDRTTYQSAFKDSNGIFFKLDAPSGYKFNILKDFRSQPSFDSVSSNFVFEIYGAESMTGTPIWSSQNDASISAANLNIVADNYTSLYVGVKMRYDTIKFVSPVLRRFYMKYSVTT